MFQEIPLDDKKIPDAKMALSEILKYRILPTDEIPKPDAVLFFNSQMVMSRQNISCVTGKAKVGKTFLMTLINEAILNKGEFQGVLSSYLPKGKDKIIYIDTEQSKYHISLILQRIKAVISNEKLENVLMFNFDALSTEKRCNATETLLYAMEDVGVCIIDGIADLVYDTNDIRESANMVDNLRKWATERDIHIINVLHQNPSQSEKMRGHLGTILTNKSETVIQISSSKEEESVKLVETLATRNKKPDNWSFEIIDGTPQIMDVTYEEPKAGRKVQKVLKNFETTKAAYIKSKNPVINDELANRTAQEHSMSVRENISVSDPAVVEKKGVTREVFPPPNRYSFIESTSEIERLPTFICLNCVRLKSSLFAVASAMELSMSH